MQVSNLPLPAITRIPLKMTPLRQNLIDIFKQILISNYRSMKRAMTFNIKKKENIKNKSSNLNLTQDNIDQRAFYTNKNNCLFAWELLTLR